MHRALASLLLLSACGPKDGGDTEVSTTAETTADTTAGTTAEPPTTGELPTTGAGVCEDPTVPVGPPVEIKIRNAGATRAFIDLELGCDAVLPFRVVAPDDTDLRINLGFSEVTCTTAFTDFCGGGDPGCPFIGQVIQIEPGATYLATWSGGSYQLSSLPAACVDKPCRECLLAQTAPAGTYTVKVAHAAEISGCDPTCTGCTPSGDGWCFTEGTRVGETLATASLAYPGTTAVEVVIP